MDDVFDLPIHELFTFSLTNSKLMLGILTSRGSTVLDEIPWNNSAENVKQRVVKIKWALKKVLGYSFSQVTETYIMDPSSKADQHFSIDVKAENSGIPFADRFYILLHYCVKKVSEEQTSMKIYAKIIYRKEIWGFIKGIIEKNTIEGLKNHFSELGRALRENENNGNTQS
ncbi:hypothetical protein JTB14_022983 [Gonioctena quinquepunctata]|nr:hypothetical protein JTB14_022983 [Gonioctena quinquepunctata]